MYLSPRPHLSCLPHSSQPPGIAIRSKPSTFRLENNDGTRNEVDERNTERVEMSICIALGITLGRGIQSLYADIKKKWETKQQQKREQRVFEEHGSARFQLSLETGRGEYQNLSDHGHRGEGLRESDYGHTRHHLRRDGQNNSQLHRTVALSPFQSLDWLDIEVDPLEDAVPTYEEGAERLPPYDHTIDDHMMNFQEESMSLGHFHASVLE